MIKKISVLLGASVMLLSKTNCAYSMDNDTVIVDNNNKILSTENILDLFLEDVNNVKLYAFDTYMDGYNIICDEFDLYSTMVARTDLFDVALKKYILLDIPENLLIDYNFLIDESVDKYNQFISDGSNYELIMKDFHVIADVDILETLLCDLSNNSPLNKINFELAYSLKNKEKDVSAYFSSQDILVKTMIVHNMPDDVAKLINSQNKMFLAASTYTSPGGLPLDYIYSTSTAVANPSTYSALLTQYHGDLVTTARASFNCHSFAWLQTIFNDYQCIWLNSFTPLIADGTYSRLNNPVYNCVITYIGHSGIVNRTNDFNPYKYKYEPYVISKWGTGPIVRHYASNCPYAQNVITFGYYKKN